MDDDHHVDKNLYWTAFIFFLGLVLLGVTWWKALIVAAIAAACWFLTYGRNIVIGVGLLVLLLGLGSWIGLLPPPSQWRPLLASATGHN
jgi:hypothetical protein